MKRDSTPLYFYKRPIRLPAFPNRKKLKVDFHFYNNNNKKVKAKITPFKFVLQ